MDFDERVQEDGGSGVWVRILAVVVITALAILMVPDDQPAPPPIPVPEGRHGQAAEKVDEEGAGTPEEPKAVAVLPTPEAGAGGVEGLEGALARAFLARATPEEARPAALVQKAAEFMEQGLAADAWLLYFKAARQGDPAAALALAEQADPAYYDPARSAFEQPDLVQAHKWYSQAARAGSREAARRLRALEARVRQMAAAGDERAALLQQEWKAKQ